MFAFLTNWLTPTSLFLFLNLTIGAIAVTSLFNSHRKPQLQRQHQEHHDYNHYHNQPLARAPSLLDRVKSMNFSMYKFSEPQTETTTFSHSTEPDDYTTGPVDPPAQLERAPSLLERVKSIKLSSFYRSDHREPEFGDEPSPSLDHVQGSDGLEHQVKRSNSEPRAVPEKKVAEKMTKSASEKGVVVEKPEEMEELEKRRPATTRLEKMVSFGDEEGVDAKADDFINRFKQQLKLQRLDSLLRYSEMLKGKQKV